jgi:hypothetical protein
LKKKFYTAKFVIEKKREKKEIENVGQSDKLPGKLLVWLVLKT